MKIIDCSIPVSNDTICYPGNTPVSVTRQRSFSSGDPFNVTDFFGSTHTGTHVDSAKHHYDNLPGIEGVPMEGLVGLAYVADLARVAEGVTKEDIDYIRHLRDFDILLLKTHNSYKTDNDNVFDQNHAYLSKEAAEFIVETGLKGIGIDCLSVEKYAASYPDAHKILLRDNRVAVIEGLNLRSVKQGFYFFACLPVNIVDSDGAPSRAVLIPEEDLPRSNGEVGVRRDGSYYTRIEWASHTSVNPHIWVNNLIDDDIERNGGTWGANTYGPANAILSFFGEEKKIGMLRIFHNVGAPVSILEELAKKIAIYITNDEKCLRFGTEKEDIDSVEWTKIAEIDMEMKEKWTNIVIGDVISAKFVRIELVSNFLPSDALPWCETSELKIYPPGR